jgi:hypothetical protein
MAAIKTLSIKTNARLVPTGFCQVMVYFRFGHLLKINLIFVLWMKNDTDLIKCHIFEILYHFLFVTQDLFLYIETCLIQTSFGINICIHGPKEVQFRQVYLTVLFTVTSVSYCLHMRWTFKVVNPRVVVFTEGCCPRENNLLRVDNLMFISYEGNNCFIIPKLP